MADDGQGITRRTPLPWSQLLIVLAIQLSEPISATVIYPFLPDFVRLTGVTGGDETRTGYYSGIIGSVFFAAECVSVVYWARASDKHGRRVVLLLGPFGLGIALVFFGLAKHFWMLVVLRALQGVFNGNIGVSKTVMAELTDATNIGDAFALGPMMWGIGITIGPIIGGLLASPAQTWPRVFGKITFLHEYPYFLPCAAAALCSFCIFTWATLFLKETHPYKKEATQLDRERAPLIHPSPSEAASRGLVAPPLRDILNRDVVVSIANYCAVSFISMVYTVLMPLMWSTSISAGGLGFSPSEIGTILAAWGFINASLQVLFLGRALRNFGGRTVYLYTTIAVLVGSVSFMLQSTFARRAGRVDATVWLFVCLHLVTNFSISAQFGASQVILVQSVTHPFGLSVANGLAQMVATAVRGLCPFLISSLFSITLQYNIAGGFFIYIFISVIALFAVGLSLLLPRRVTKN
ncbi:MFS general substrate transporter [Cylindrobasidium torrendii FP15055 ss-10]|uniref:MFS general substrate transporter n=1 Tax=Cylindrobasidium torrendii FP15055 ss-10 TaxID=1314674 RepID=A0A0D7BL11_9AGAR|nr:MFS general substrate transporter [Cylindrobasidium torrendii FP15055 ss-10]